MIRFFVGIVVILGTILFTARSMAARVAVVNGKNVTVENDDIEMEVGDVFFTVDSQGKRKGIIEITVISTSEADAVLLKGKPEVGQTLKPRISAEVREANTEAKRKAESVRKPWYFQTRIGIGVSYFNIYGSGAGDTKYDPGIAGVLAFETHVFGVAFETGLQFYQAGFAASSASAKVVATLNYVGVPIVAKFNLSSGVRSSYKFKLGVMPAYLTSGNLKLEALGQTINSSVTTSDKLDFAGLVGFEYAETSSSIFTDFQFLYSIKKYQNGDGSTSGNIGGILSIGTIF